MIFAMLKHAMLIVANRGGGLRERENFFPKHTPPPPLLRLPALRPPPRKLANQPPISNQQTTPASMYKSQTSLLNRENPHARRLYRISRICRLRQYRLRLGLPEYLAKFQSLRTITAHWNACRRYDKIKNLAWQQYEQIFYSRFPVQPLPSPIPQN